jgi:hypothetical protein
MNGLIAALGFVVFGFEIEHGSALQAHTVGFQAADARPDTAGANPALRAEMPPELVIGGEGSQISLRGHIAPGDGARIARTLAARRAQGTPVREVSMNSTGGSLHEALMIGRMLRAAGVATHLPADAICYSACPYMFAGGQDRIADAQGRFGVHQEHIDQDSSQDSAQTAVDVQQSSAQVMRYLAEMGIDLGLMEPTMATPPDRIHMLSPLELARYHLTTSPRPS